MRTALRRRRDLNVGISIAPEERNSRHPIFGFDRVAHARGIFDRQDASGRREFRPRDLSPNCAGSNLDLRVVPNALHLAELAVRHEVEFVALFGEPNGCGDGNPRFPEGGKRDVLLSVDRSGDGHRHIVINVESRNNSGREWGRSPGEWRAVIQ
jgi:hypothetical protein